MPKTPGGWLGTWGPVALFGLLWFDLVRQLSYQWSASDQYAYGWFVPLLAAGLFLLRWADRPAAASPTVRGPASGAVALLALSLLPVRVVYEINPDWPLPSWLEALVVVGLSLYAMWLMGGRLWVVHFAFPIGFILVAVRWPYRLEHGLIQGLMRVVAGLTVEVLDWFNVPVLPEGNLIRVSGGLVGVDEACSGIRSFQSTLMGALFMGELYRMRGRMRGLFLAGGLALAFGFNVVRTLLLTWRASTAGVNALAQWHDSAGFGIFLASFACLWALAAWLARKPPPLQRSARPLGAAAAYAPLVPVKYLAGLGCWMAVVLLLTEGWYRTHDAKDRGGFHWTLKLPHENTGFEKLELPARTVRMLAYDEGVSARWSESDGAEWTVNFFRWKPRSVESVIHARLHRPEICLPAAGFRQVSESERIWLGAGRLELPFRKYVYQAEGRVLYVFFCQWEDGSERQAGMHASKGADRLQSVLTGRRWLGQQTLEFIIAGCASLDQAEARLRAELPSLISLEEKQ